MNTSTLSKLAQFCLAVYLVLVGIGILFNVAVPSVLLGVLALVAGILMLIVWLRGVALFAVVLALSLTFAAPVSAQEATPEATPVVIEGETPVTIENEDGGTVNIDTPSPALDTSSLLSFALYLLLAIAGGGSFALVLSRLDARGKDALEKAFLSSPPNTQETVRDLVELVGVLAKLGYEVTDGLPNTPSDVPPMPSAFSQPKRED